MGVVRPVATTGAYDDVDDDEDDEGGDDYGDEDDDDDADDDDEHRPLPSPNLLITRDVVL